MKSWYCLLYTTMLCEILVLLTLHHNIVRNLGIAYFTPQYCAKSWYCLLYTTILCEILVLLTLHHNIVRNLGIAYFTPHRCAKVIDNCILCSYWLILLCENRRQLHPMFVLVYIVVRKSLTTASNVRTIPDCFYVLSLYVCIFPLDIQPTCTYI